jgi:hypothetical protein
MQADLRAALRTLRRSPLFAATAISTLAVGIGASSAIFSLVQAVLLQPLPFREPNRLIRLWESNPAGGHDRALASKANVEDWRERSKCQISRFEFSTSFVERAELDRSPDDAPLYAVVERLQPED